MDDSGLRELVGYQLKRADLAMQKLFAQEIGEPFQLRQIEFSVLVLLACNERLTHKRVSAALGVAPSNMVSVMSALEARGLVIRRRNPTDGRSSFWQITEAGATLEHRAVLAVRAMEMTRFGIKDEQARRDLAGSLDSLWASE
ncbi:MarR family winged helix-turn-helix transcriptional regulator [Salinisphaera sp. LB1]|uniref:MarR family winged helix-turn-helix transcriptional regulator n=1 Tax=Salinisphaera sp. LB1 TaxID=2183911 RepID=UPI000D70524D|nr:MarR family winged helix-turn-helix transcriptional regulator [Salinisphaera sp. LB1]AWN15302.1 Transcriptional regulator, MarR family [Salinisphaera sp. LB1]